MGMYQPSPWHGHYNRPKPRLALSAVTAATISGGTPSPSTTDTTPNVGFTTNYRYGDAYAVIATSALTGITIEQIAAGTDQLDNPLSATQVFTGTVTDTTVSMPQTSVSALATGTWYAAAFHDNYSAPSSVLAWSFTITSSTARRIGSMNRGMNRGMNGR